MAPERMGNTFDEEILKSPLTVGRPGKEPGPDVHNNPVAKPDDPLGFSPSNSKKIGHGTTKGKEKI